jgi:flavorubredoxin/NADPH-dependent 2,4-dienoyl-CoA reductase/sulfur reductase-like enzyme/rubredoxin
MGALKVKENLFWVGVQDHDIRVFDIVMYTEYGTSYNSFLLKTGRHTVLFETVKLKFFDRFLANIKEVCDPSEIDYIVIDHTEPDHAGSLEKLLDYAPKAKVLASNVALSYLKEICNREIPGKAVADDEVLELDGLHLHFLSVPFLHWPDSIYTYIPELKTLVTCDSFGCHYADDKVFNDQIEGDFTPAYRYYFNCIMGPFKPYVRYALERIKPLAIETICCGHGPVLRKEIAHYIGLYEEWSRPAPETPRDRPKVVTAFVSAYGYSERLAREISAGVRDVIDADISLRDMVTEDFDKVLAEIKAADGFLLGTCTINGDALPPIMNLAMGLNGVTEGGKVAGVFGSYGWSGEGPEMVMNRLSLLRMKTVEPAFKVMFNPDNKDKLAQARHYGQKFGKKLQEEWVKLKIDPASGKTWWKCTVCGEVFEGAMPPQNCPVCGAGQEAFIEYTPETVTFREDRALRVAIIGSGAGGLAAAEAVRKRNALAQIDLYTREEMLPYYRPVLTRALAEKVEDTEYFIHPPSFYEKNRIALHLGATITRLAPREKSFQTADGQVHSYDKLVLATGAACFIPPIQGAHLSGVVALREKTDFDHLNRLLAGGAKRVAIIGGGLLGLETAWSLSRLGHRVTVLEACPSVLPRQLDPEGSPLFSQLIRRSGVEVHYGVYVEEILGEERVSGLKTRSPQEIPADVVIISAGIRPNVELAKEAGLRVERGIEVNERMQTSDSDIFAVGDCAAVHGRCAGLWEPASLQGSVAGANLCGDERAYACKLYGASLAAFGTRLFSIGDLGAGEGPYEQISAVNGLSGTYRKIFFKDGHITGGVLLGDVKLTNPLLLSVTRNLDTEAALERLRL